MLFRSKHLPSIIKPFHPDTNIDLSLTKLKTTFAPVNKVFAFIMAILVLSFSMIPCADGASFAKDEAGKYSLAKNSQDEPHDDACSPFCICTCCAGFSVTCNSTALSGFAIPFKLSHSSFIAARTHSIASSIWQPPQLV